jgi:hypothetical protein
VEVKQSTRRVLAYGSNATLVTLMVIAVMVALYALSDAYRSRIDLSEGAQNTLQPDTVQKLSLLDQDAEEVTLTGFTHQRGKDDSAFKDRAVKDLLKEVGARSTAVKWKLVDFDRERLTAEKLGVTDYGRVVLQRGKDRVDLKDRELFRRVGKGRDRRIEFVGEAALSRAFSQLMTPSRRAVYVLTGHGELDPRGTGPDGLSELVGELDKERYDVETINLIATTREGELPSIPDDAEVVFVARPLRDLTPQEEDALLGWVGRGGAVLVAGDVGTAAPELLKRLNLSFSDGVALQPEMQVPYRDRPIPVYGRHAITADLRDDQLVTVLSHPAAVRRPDTLPEGVRAEVLLKTTRGGWIDRGGELVAGGAVYDPEFDIKGPHDLAYAVTIRPGTSLVRPGKPQARIVVMGDADFFTNAIVGEAPGNAVLGVNLIHWLAGDDRRLGVTVGTVGRATKVRRLALTEEDLSVLRWISIGLMPLVIFLLGIATWLSRRGR